ncbi:MAG: hypothetical protein EAZ92_09400, partial [Candidatus Kapaibacterium sp.]
MKQRKIRVEEALEYHSSGRKGKIEVIPTKPCNTQYELSLAYSPGVAEPCRAIAENEELVYEYTAKGNLVAVISNGTAVLGLGNIGASASKPVMEGKGVLFKKFADIDVFDIEISTQDPEEFITTVANLEPTFGGINLEDINEIILENNGGYLLARSGCHEVQKCFVREKGDFKITEATDLE